MVACVYLPDFPAWATYRCARPRVPVVVVHRGRVASASPRARRAGVEVGMSGDRAARLVPGCHVAVRDRGLEAAAWEEALEAVLGVSPYVEAGEPGWAFVRDATQAELAALAEGIGARVGLAPARSLARVAAVRAAPRYVLAVPAAQVSGFLERTEASVLGALGFSETVVERLPLLGFGDLRRVRGLTKRHLTAQFGDEGEALYAMLHPSPREAPVPAFAPPPTLRSRADLDDAVREPGDVGPLVEGLAREVAGVLGPLRCRRLTVRLGAVGEAAPRVAARVLPESSADPGRLSRAACAMALEMLGADVWVESATVELAGLTAGVAEQGALFRARPSARMAVRGVHRRFPGAIRRALVVTDANFHEDAVRYEPYPEAEDAPVRRRRAS